MLQWLGEWIPKFVAEYGWVAALVVLVVVWLLLLLADVDLAALFWGLAP